MLAPLLFLPAPQSANASPVPAAPASSAATVADVLDSAAVIAEVPFDLPASTVERRLPGLDGRPVRALLHTLPGEVPARRPGQMFTIAVQRWIGARIAEIPPAHRSPTFICPLAPTGRLFSGLRCELERTSPHAAQLARLVNLLYPRIAADSAVMPTGGRGAPQGRSLRFTLRLDPASWPAPWQPGGEPTLHGPVSTPIYSLMQQQWSYRYPPAALRAGASALVMADCGIESDRSISCRTASIIPSESEPYFRGVIEGEMPRYRAPETLSDGRTTSGLEFRAPLRFMMAD